jgi:nucleoporin NUP82
MDTPEDAFSANMDLRPYDQKTSVEDPLALIPRRAPYQVPAIFYAKSPLENFVEKHVPHRQRHTLKEQVRLSPATLDLVTTAHRVLSAHTNALERAASDLFRRCERLQGEIKDQLKQLSDVAERIKGVSSEVDEDGTRKEGARDGVALDKRLQAAKDKQSELVQRYDTLRKKLLNSGGRPLSEKEKAWISEVNTLSGSIGETQPKPGEEDQQLAQRLETVCLTPMVFFCIRSQINIQNRSNPLPPTLWQKPKLSQQRRHRLPSLQALLLRVALVPGCRSDFSVLRLPMQ